nr:O-antigen ligase family protein [uncultured Blautia sp.]
MRFCERISKENMMLIGTLFFCVYMFLLDNSYWRATPILILTVMLVYGAHGAKLSVDSNFLILLLVVVTMSVIGGIVTSHSPKLAIEYYVYLVFIRILGQNDVKKHYKSLIINALYYITLVLVLYNMIKNVVNFNDTNTFETIGTTPETGVFIFLFFLLSIKCKKVSGLIVTIIYVLIWRNAHSRGLMLMLSLFVVISILSKRIEQFMKKVRISSNKIFMIIIMMTIGIIVFSYAWESLAAKGFLGRLDDMSNRVRFVANIKTVDTIKENSFELLLSGYGHDLFAELGIESEDYLSHPTYHGVRIVQSHNTVLNIIIRLGIIPGFIYLYLVSKYLEKHMVRENYAFIIPYMVNSLILHEMFIMKWLVLWCLILEMPFEKKWFPVKKIMLMPITFGNCFKAGKNNVV